MENIARKTTEATTMTTTTTEESPDEQYGDIFDKTNNDID
jgi:hypothetical protein